MVRGPPPSPCHRVRGQAVQLRLNLALRCGRGVKKAAYAGIAAIAAIAALFVINTVASDTTGTGRADFVFHARLADPDLYVGGTYDRAFGIAAGTYAFKFIPNGDSPRILSIDIEGDSFSFSDDFELEGTLHKSPISEYYTWDYNGQKTFDVPAGQNVSITIDPHGNLLGPVSVMIAAASP